MRATATCTRTSSGAFISIVIQRPNQLRSYRRSRLAIRIGTAPFASMEAWMRQPSFVRDTVVSIVPTRCPFSYTTNDAFPGV